MATFKLYFSDGCEEYGDIILSHDHRETKEEFIKDCKFLLKEEFENRQEEHSEYERFAVLHGQLISKMGYVQIYPDYSVKVDNLK